MTQKESEIQFVGTQKDKKCCFCGAKDRVKYQFDDDKYLCDLCFVSINFLRDWIKVGDKMTQKERLIELLTGKSIDQEEDVDYVADYLLSNGVIVPPCKVGDVVYLIMAAYSTLDKSTYFAVPIEGVVDCISFCGERGNEIDIRLNSDFGGEIVYRTFEDYKKSFFLDRKEAVAALQDILGEAAEQALKERDGFALLAMSNGSLDVCV